jgi:hypothetical protein
MVRQLVAGPVLFHQLNLTDPSSPGNHRTETRSCVPVMVIISIPSFLHAFLFRRFLRYYRLHS